MVLFFFLVSAAASVGGYSVYWDTCDRRRDAYWSLKVQRWEGPLRRGVTCYCHLMVAYGNYLGLPFNRWILMALPYLGSDSEPSYKKCWLRIANCNDQQRLRSWAVGRYRLSVSLERIKKSCLLETRTRPFSVTVPGGCLIVWVIKWSRMRWAGNVARTEDKRGAYKGLVGRHDQRDHLEDLGLEGTIILKRIFKK